MPTGKAKTVTAALREAGAEDLAERIEAASNKTPHNRKPPLPVGTKVTMRSNAWDEDGEVKLWSKGDQGVILRQMQNHKIDKAVQRRMGGPKELYMYEVKLNDGHVVEVTENGVRETSSVQVEAASNKKLTGQQLFNRVSKVIDLSEYDDDDSPWISRNSVLWQVHPKKPRKWVGLEVTSLKDGMIQVKLQHQPGGPNGPMPRTSFDETVPDADLENTLKNVIPFLKKWNVIS